MPSSRLRERALPQAQGPELEIQHGPDKSHLQRCICPVFCRSTSEYSCALILVLFSEGQTDILHFNLDYCVTSSRETGTNVCLTLWVGAGIGSLSPSVKGLKGRKEALEKSGFLVSLINKNLRRGSNGSLRTIYQIQTKQNNSKKTQGREAINLAAVRRRLERRLNWHGGQPHGGEGALEKDQESPKHL